MRRELTEASARGSDDVVGSYRSSLGDSTKGSGSSLGTCREIVGRRLVGRRQRGKGATNHDQAPTGVARKGDCLRPSRRGVVPTKVLLAGTVPTRPRGAARGYRRLP
ncbi:hypothetical protein GW17_00045431 [Ensete ventricosum]|nr:hypothetical protein GW17_00045431 [Ensete ventricosum]